MEFCFFTPDLRLELNHLPGPQIYLKYGILPTLCIYSHSLFIHYLFFLLTLLSAYLFVWFTEIFLNIPFFQIKIDEALPVVQKKKNQWQAPNSQTSRVLTRTYVSRYLITSITNKYKKSNTDTSLQIWLELTWSFLKKK